MNIIFTQNNKGMTLIEMVIVVSLLAGLLLMSAPFIRRKENAIKQTFRRLIAINRDLDSRSRLQTKIYRLVFFMDPNSHLWWVEKLQGHQLPSIKSPSKDMDHGTPYILPKKKLDETESLSEEQPEPSFIFDDSFFDEPQKLPKNLKFLSMESSDKKQVVIEGPFYVYYFPVGQTNKIVIQIKGKKQVWSLSYDRLHGDLEIINKAVSLENQREKLL